MTQEILLLNPRPKRRRKAGTKKRTTRRKRAASRRRKPNPAKRRVRRPVATKGFRPMAKRRRRKTTTRRRAIRRNPSRRTARRIVRRASSGFRGLNIKSALHSVPLRVLGMFIAKWAAKRGTPNALEADPSTWNGMTYLKGFAGAYAGAVIGNMIKPGVGQRILEGGATLLIYKAVQNHLIPKNNWLTGQFGAEGGGYPAGAVEVNSEGEPFIMGQDGQWRPMDDTPGLEGFADYGEDDWTTMGQNALEPPGPLGFADVLEPPGRLGASPTNAAYARAIYAR